MKCKRCGKCCYYLKNDILLKCRYLIGEKITSCRIYKNRLGTIIDTNINGMKIFCDERKNVTRQIPGCVFNKIGEKYDM
jgi:hypothetical protein